MDRSFEKWALPVVHKAMKVMLLENFYPVKLEWRKEIRDDAIAGFSFTHPYLSLTIQYSDSLVKEWKEKKYHYIKNILVHEVCHALTDPLFNAGYVRFITKDTLEDEREKLTDHIANIVLKNRLM